MADLKSTGEGCADANDLASSVLSFLRKGSMGRTNQNRQAIETEPAANISWRESVQSDLPADAATFECCISDPD